MTNPRPHLPSNSVASAFLTACREELSALKPGNVHIHADGHAMTVADFEAAAQAATPWIAAPGLRVGQRIENAVDASFGATGCNTNLGIVLLAAPLAFAAMSPPATPTQSTNLQHRLRVTLSELDVSDAEHAFAAIARANPGGLGNTSKYDVHTFPDISLLTAMKEAAGRDRIAKAYIDTYQDIFEFGLPAFRTALANTEKNVPLAISTLHMHYLAQFPDTHIARKHGAEAATSVQRQAEELRPLWQPTVKPEKIEELLAFDRTLKADGLNPGTTADFVVTTLFAHKLEDNLAKNPRA
ncbi:MAG: triphosphoribosyl-dephospho-CoA synthase [Hyphomicrobiaceae bacterium]